MKYAGIFGSDEPDLIIRDDTHMILHTQFVYKRDMEIIQSIFEDPDIPELWDQVEAIGAYREDVSDPRIRNRMTNRTGIKEMSVLSPDDALENVLYGGPSHAVWDMIYAPAVDMQLTCWVRQPKIAIVFNTEQARTYHILKGTFGKKKPNPTKPTNVLEYKFPRISGEK